MNNKKKCHTEKTKQIPKLNMNVPSAEEAHTTLYISSIVPLSQLTPADIWLKPIEVAEHLGLPVTDGDGSAWWEFGLQQQRQCMVEN